MPNESTTILGVNPGSRYVGFSAFRGPELLDWGVRIITAKTPRGQVRVANRILREAIERFQPGALVVKRLHWSRSSPSLDRLTGAILELSRHRRIEVHQYSITQLKYVLCRNRRSNKRRLAAELVAMYPVLRQEFQKEMASRHPYYLTMFEAVALGVVHYRQSGE